MLEPIPEPPEPLYRAAFEHALDAVVITDDTGLYVDVNDAACDLLARPREELVGKIGAADLAVLDDFGRFWRAFLEAGLLTGVVDVRRPDGSIRHVEFAARASIAPGRHLAILRDRTEARNEQRLRDEERALLEQMQEVASIGGWTWDTAQDVAVWSDDCCRMAGVPPGSVKDLAGYLAVVHPEDRHIVVEAAQQATSSDQPFEAEHRIVRPDGEVRWVLVRGRQQRHPDGRPTRKLVGIAKDLTAAKRAQDDVRRAEDQLRLAQKLEAVAVLAGGIAHDFNNILSVILGFTSLALEDPALPPDARDNLREVRGATDRAVTLTRQLLAFSRRQILEPRPVDLNELVGAMVPMIRRLVGENIRIEVELATESAWVTADPGGLEQIVMNLVVNGRDAMPDGGVLTLEIREAEPPRACSMQAIGGAGGPCIELTVRDTGHGFDTATKARLFEPFFTTKAVGKGTGLGLPTVFGIVQQSGGCVDVESSPGCGATFRVYLARQRASQPAPLTGDEVPVYPGCETILLVEDDDQVRALCRKVLQRSGYHVLDAANAGEAILASEGHPGPVDLLLTDLVMPRMSGRLLAARLLAARPSMKVLYMSGYTDDPAVKAEIASASTPFLPKPVAPGMLGRKVRQVLDDVIFRSMSPPRGPRGGGAGDPR